MCVCVLGRERKKRTAERDKKERRGETKKTERERKRDGENEDKRCVTDAVIYPSGRLHAELRVCRLDSRLRQPPRRLGGSDGPVVLREPAVKTLPETAQLHALNICLAHK